VSIAAYREPELVPTVRDCLDKAQHPERLRFGICWQHTPDETLPEWMAAEQFRIIDVDAGASGGANWARAQVQGLWQGEEWYLQLDSHHRFSRDWDAFLLEEIARTGSDRPVLTTYGPPYLPGDEDQFDEPMSMAFREFTPDGLAMFIPAVVPGWQERTSPRPARFASAHLLFAASSFLADVPCDPDLYFTGDEGILAVRAYTHGYDLFEPSRVVVWHQYVRNGQPKHWDDHVGEAAGPAWYELDEVSRAKLRRIVTDSDGEGHGLGGVRTLADYEAYAGISFRHRVVQDYTRRNRDAPNPPADPDWPCDVIHPERVPGIAWETSGDRHVASIPGPDARRGELNSSGAFLVELADGRHSVREIAAYLRAAHELGDDPTPAILDFYSEACSAGLVTWEDHDG
jgi:hypothetical protein